MIRIMKSSTTATAAYKCPICRVIEIDSQELICTSPFGEGNEQYEDGDTSGWYSF